MIAVARGNLPADLLLTNARIVNTLTGEIESGNVAICQGRIAGIGDYHEANELIDLGGHYLAPGFLEGHVHLESSMLHPAQYASAVVPRGITSIVSDLHEIANVAGLAGLRFVKDCARELPLDVFIMAPSCVPATSFETSGAALDAADLENVLKWDNVLGLGEMMNFPGVLAADETVLTKIATAQGRVIDGHAPGLSGKVLNAYVSAGIRSDHESVTVEEGREKLRRGMRLMIRQGTAERNLEALLPLVTDKTYKRCLFVVDDRSCTDLLRDGSVDAVVRQAIRAGLDPVRAIQMATINTAEYFRLHNHGAIAPGFVANMAVFSSLADLTADMVFHHGKKVAEGGALLASSRQVRSRKLLYTFHVKPFSVDALKLMPADPFPVIELVPGQIVTRKTMMKPTVADAQVQPDVGRDLLKLVVVERHRATGNIGLGLVKGLGLKRGAIASSVAHDSHNIIVAGANDADIFAAVKGIEKMQGGLVCVLGGKVLASLPLPIAGLLSDKPLDEVAAELESLEQTAAVVLGATHPSPFAILSFLALPVIPELRLTDLGLVDVISFRLLDLYGRSNREGTAQ